MASGKPGAEPAWPPPEEFADRLARLRRARPLSNQEIADAVGLENSNTVSNWKGGQTPQGMVLLKLARLFDVSPEWLLGGEEADQIDDEGADPIIPKGKRRGIRQPSVKRQIVKVENPRKPKKRGA